MSEDNQNQRPSSGRGSNSSLNEILDTFLACFEELKFLTAANNDSAVLAQIAQQLLDVCNKLLEQSTKQDETNTALQSLIGELEALCQKVLDGTQANVDALQDVVAQVTELCTKQEATTAAIETASTANTDAVKAVCTKQEATTAAIETASTANTDALKSVCDKQEGANTTLSEIRDSGTLSAEATQKLCDKTELATTEKAAQHADVIACFEELKNKKPTHLIEGCILEDPADPDSKKISAFTVVDGDGVALFDPLPLTSLGFVECC